MLTWLILQISRKFPDDVSNVFVWTRSPCVAQAVVELAMHSKGELPLLIVLETLLYVELSAASSGICGNHRSKSFC